MFEHFQLLKEIKDEKEFLMLLSEKPDQYFYADLDCIISFNVNLAGVKNTKKTGFFSRRRYLPSPWNPTKGQEYLTHT
ncbi:MAG: hypothetical protein ACTSWN_08395 [Promethearchaeota archaeon]